MFDASTVIDVILTVFLLPLQLILLPFDLLLSRIPDIGLIPTTLTSVISYIGQLPTTLVHISGVNPILWNITVTIFLLFVSGVPIINMFKKIWAFLRP